MAILDRFRHKWNHSDPAVRADSVRELDDVEILVRIAREDRDPAVRRLAVKRLTDADALFRVAEGEVDEGIRRLAHDKGARLHLDAVLAARELSDAEPLLAKLSGPTHLAEVARMSGEEPIALAALARLNDPKELGDVARRARHVAVRLQAVTRVTEPAILARVAAADEDERVVTAALDRLDDPASLRELAARVSRKSTRRQVLQKLEGLGGLQAPPSKKRRAAQLEVVSLAESLASSFGREGATGQIAAAQARWADLSTDATPDLRRRFEEAVEAFSRNHGARSSASPSAVTPSSEPAATSPLPGADGAASVVAEPAATFGMPAPPAPPPPAPIPSLEVRRATAMRLVEEAERLLPTTALQRARRKLDDVQSELGRLALPEEEAPELRARLATVSDALSREEEGRRKLQAEKAGRIEAQCAKLEALAASAVRAEIVAGMREGQGALKDLEHLPKEVERAVRARLQAALQLLPRRLEELREAETWERWSTQPAREELCKRIEALAGESDMRKVGRELAELRREWDLTHPKEASRGDDLDARFFKIARELRLKCNEHFGKLATERKSNLELKVAICEKAEAMSSSTDWEETAQALKALQDEWKTIGPIPRAQAEVVWQRFKAACDPYFTRRKEHYDALDEQRNKSLEQKVELCVRVEALAESEDVEGAVAAAKKAQDEWKDSGPVPRKDRDAIWKRFRQACDKVFDLRERRVQIEEERTERKRRELCDRVLELANAPATETLPADVLALLKEWRGSGAVRADRAPELRAAFDDAIGKVLEAHPASFVGTELDPEAGRRRREELCSKVEALKPKVPLSLPKAATLDQMVEHLRTALNSNTPQDKKPEAEWRDLSRELERFQGSWDRLGPMPGAAGQALEARFRKACQDFYERRRGNG